MSRGPRFGPATTVAALALAGVAMSCVPGDRAPHHRVEIRNAAFAPEDLEVEPGDTITFTNHDIVPHTATAGGWDSGALGPGESYTMIVGETDATDYACLYHPTMTGRLVTP